MARERGALGERLDYEKLAAACKAHGIQEPSYTGNVLLRNKKGHSVVLSTEGVAPTKLPPVGFVYLDTQFSLDWQCLPLAVVEDCRDGEVVDLADHVRAFGSRLEANHWAWFQWVNEGDE